MIEPEHAVDQFLEQVLSGELTLAELRHVHPELGDEAIRLLATAERVWRAGYRMPGADELELGRRRLLAELATLEPAVAAPWWRRWPSLQPMMVARAATAAVIALALAAGGVTAAATQSEPGSVLFPYRLALEETRVNLASADERADLYLDLADSRLELLARAAALRRPERVIVAGDAYAQALERGVAALRRARATETAERIAAQNRQYRDALTAHAAILDATAAQAVATADAVIFDLAGSARDGITALDAPPGPGAETTPLAGTPEPAPAATSASPSSAPLPTVSVYPTVTAAAPSSSPAAIPSRPPDQAPRTVQIHGVVTRLSRTELVVAGHLVLRDAGPLDIDGVLAVGVTVGIVAERRADGTLVARRIRVAAATGSERPATTAPPGPLPSPTPRPAAQASRFSVRGLIRSLEGVHWVVGDTAVVVDPSVVRDLRVLGDPAVGRRASVAGRVAPDGTRLAIRVVVVPASDRTVDAPAPDRPATDVPQTQRFELAGVIRAFEPPWLTVDDVRILVSREDAPRLQVTGEPVIGARVNVAGIERTDGTRIALRIVFHAPTALDRPARDRPANRDRPNAEGRGRAQRPFRLQGVVRAFEPPWLTVGDRRVRVSREAVPDLQIRGELQVGSTVEVQGRIRPNGTAQALRISVIEPARAGAARLDLGR